MKIVNYTPHAIAETTTGTTFAPSGIVASYISAGYPQEYIRLQQEKAMAHLRNGTRPDGEASDMECDFYCSSSSCAGNELPSACFDAEDDALAYIAESFQTEWENIGTWEDEDGRTLVFMTQDAADAAADNSDVIAKITALA
jgi:hypothetical protein